MYSGPWVSDAKRYFSKVGGAAYQIGKDHLKGAANRQAYLETAIKWISSGNIEDYMGKHQHDDSANSLWAHFRAVIAWAESCFKTRPGLMRGVDWGWLYDKYHDKSVDREAIEKESKRLILDDDVKRNSGIYAYILTGDPRHLDIRSFTPKMRQQAYEKQGGICPLCGETFPLKQMEADHITPWVEGGATVEQNCQMLCKKDNRRKGAK